MTLDHRGLPTRARREILRHVPGALTRAGVRLRQLDRGELGLLLQAPVLLPLASLALKRWGLRRVQATLPGTFRPYPDPATRQAAAERLAWCVQVAAAYAPWPANCLQRSVVLWWFLRRRGLEGDMRIGVRRDPASGALDFHAWVEHGGVVINDRRDIRRLYATFDAAIAPDGVTFH